MYTRATVAPASFHGFGRTQPDIQRRCSLPLPSIVFCVQCVVLRLCLLDERLRVRSTGCEMVVGAHGRRDDSCPRRTCEATQYRRNHGTASAQTHFIHFLFSPRAQLWQRVAALAAGVATCLKAGGGIFKWSCSSPFHGVGGRNASNIQRVGGTSVI